MPFITDPSRREEYKELVLKKINKNKKAPSLRYRWYKFREWRKDIKKFIKDNPKEALVYVLSGGELLNVIFNCIQTFK